MIIKPKFKLGEEVFFFTNVSKLVDKGVVVGLWVLGKEGEEIFNYQIEYKGKIEKEVGKGKKKKKVIVDSNLFELVPEDNMTLDEGEMTKIFIPHVKKAITNKIKMVRDEIKAMDQKLQMVNEERVEATKLIDELEGKFKEFEKDE